MNYTLLFFLVELISRVKTKVDMILFFEKHHIYLSGKMTEQDLQ